MRRSFRSSLRTGNDLIKNTHLFEKDDYECFACGRKVSRPTDRCPGCGVERNGQRSGHDWTEDAAFLDIVTGRL